VNFIVNKLLKILVNERWFLKSLDIPKVCRANYFTHNFKLFFRNTSVITSVMILVFNSAEHKVITANIRLTMTEF